MQLIVGGKGDREFLLDGSDGALVRASHGLHVVEEGSDTVFVVGLVNQMHTPLLAFLRSKSRVRLGQLLLQEVGLFSQLLELGLVVQGQLHNFLLMRSCFRFILELQRL